MIICQTKKWGNSLGVIIPKNDAFELGLHEDEEIAIDIVKKDSPLKELFGFGKSNKITKQQFEETRALLESGRF